MSATTALTQNPRPNPAARRAGGASRGAAGARRRPRRLSGPTRKAVLLVHVLSAGIWMGVDVIVGVLVLGVWLNDDPGLRGVAYQALGTFVWWPMLVSGLVCLVSGIVLGIGSKYGLVRYVWVAIKLVLNVVLCMLIVVLLRPVLADLVDTGRTLTAGGTPEAQPVSDLAFPPVVSLLALTWASWLSVFKPWGLTPAGRRRAS